MANLVLGLDLGPNSIGWALLGDGAEGDSQLVDMGVRVFPEGVDAFDTAKERSRNEDRRINRGMRRQIRRRARRKRLLQAALVESGLWPVDAAAQEEALAVDPYWLRAKGVSERLEPYEIGRVFLHLNQRRGFLSNKKKDRGDKEVQGMLAEIKHNEELVALGGFETVGQLLAEKCAALDHTARQEDDEVRNRHLSRRQLVDEFHTIWSKQATFHPQLLTDKLRDGTVGGTMEPRKAVPKHDPRRNKLSDLKAFGLFGLIFFQRRMYWPKSVVGLCELESKEKRCPKGDRRAERFRVLQEVNNLRYIDTAEGDEQPLSEEQRRLLIDYLSDREKATFDQIRKKLGFLESVKFNFERGKRTALKGFLIDWMIAKETDKSWYDRPEAQRDEIVRILLDNERDDERILTTLIDKYGFSTVAAETLLEIDFPPGYGSLSLKAIDKLLPSLERGLVYQSISDPEESALHAAGYLRRDELQRRLFDKLPNLARTRPADCKLGDIPNPVVKRALVELRKVVNSIVVKYGKPSAVHVEMAREVQMGAERRKEITARMRAREAEREKAAEAIRKMGYAARRDSVTKYMLWQEQGHECVYCGKPISQTQLFGGEIDVDHVLPYSRTLDNSQGNKVVGHVKCNHLKGNRTPYEWLAAGDAVRYAEVCQRAAALLQKGMMPYGKYRKFLQKQLDLDKFIARQLTDTGYITRATVEYLRLLFEKDHEVLGLKGQLTAELRWQWGLDKILEELPDSPAWIEKNDLRPGEKNRADHRHHAIDAIVVALTNRKRLHKLSELVRRGGAKKHGEILEEPWPDFRDTVVERVKGLKVSHRVERKVRGALHEETLYGPTPTEGEWVVRKPVENLSPAEVERIRDAGIRTIVLESLRKRGIDFGRGKKPDAKKMKEALSNLRMPSGVPIKKVRILKQEQTIQPLRDAPEHQAYVKPGSTHHLCIFEFEEKGKKKRKAIFVTMLDAAKRQKRGEPIISRTHPERPDAKFIMSLSSREMVLANWNGEQKLLVYKTAASTQGQIYFAEHTDARRSSDQAKFVASANSLDARKVTVDPLGRIRWAND
ncbi:type II CRISPR RNA-guided endonuclease Cas9 [Lacipirellula limnantheis]|uniref:CRISPR-associated endonuclease Cas9 n=1 Tax=Lacipirellula limnantheis TaxID=2528024 RepID=A0A517TX54_9BACT|nr:type II CRISPR RNA-guided endonuclease Cas9 [Lacipirellula limnantheis]QDT72950.1 CRISPR-associated endonuclease Cas9/Csn1 [Lacipirellula limnantheis]